MADSPTPPARRTPAPRPDSPPTARGKLAGTVGDRLLLMATSPVCVRGAVWQVANIPAINTWGEKCVTIPARNAVGIIENQQKMWP